MGSAMLLECVASGSVFIWFVWFLFIHALCLASVYRYDTVYDCPYSDLMHSICLPTFIYLPNFVNLMMQHLVLRYQCPHRVGGRGKAGGSTGCRIYWVEYWWCNMNRQGQRWRATHGPLDLLYFGVNAFYFGGPSCLWALKLTLA